MHPAGNYKTSTFDRRHCSNRWIWMAWFCFDLRNYRLSVCVCVGQNKKVDKFRC